VEAVITLMIWPELGGRRVTLKGALVTATEAIPGLLRRPFYLFVARVSSVAILRALLYLPQHAAAVLVLTSELGPASKSVLFALSMAGSALNGLIDSRLLMLLPVAAIERTGVLDGFRRCWQLTSHHWIRLLGVVVLVWCFTEVLQYSSGILLRAVAGFLRDNDLGVLLAVAVLLLNGSIRAYGAVVATVCYWDMRVANGEIAAEQPDVSRTE